MVFIFPASCWVIKNNDTQFETNFRVIENKLLVGYKNKIWLVLFIYFSSKAILYSV